ncbi:MAG TPA: hypothetical protein VMR86_09385 [Myxococcota bacterium]|nr:hypothetical protein [Myxococcota bacterium]
MRARIAWAVLVAALACAGTQTPPPVAAEPPRDAPPADLQSETLVRCLIDTPDGCSGCDQGDTCVYKQMKEYDCVYIVYGTKCS